MRDPTWVDRITSHLGRTEAFPIAFLTCAAIYLPALGVPDLKDEEGRRILPAVAAALNSFVPDHEPIHIHKPGCQDSLFYLLCPGAQRDLLNPAQIHVRFLFLLLHESACQQLKGQPAIALQLGKMLYRFTYRFQDDFQLVERLTETRSAGTTKARKKQRNTQKRVGPRPDGLHSPGFFRFLGLQGVPDAMGVRIA